MSKSFKSKCFLAWGRHKIASLPCFTLLVQICHSCHWVSGTPGLGKSRTLKTDALKIDVNPGSVHFPVWNTRERRSDSVARSACRKAGETFLVGETVENAGGAGGLGAGQSWHWIPAELCVILPHNLLDFRVVKMIKCLPCRDVIRINWENVGQAFCRILEKDMG